MRIKFLILDQFGRWLASHTRLQGNAVSQQWLSYNGFLKTSWLWVKQNLTQPCTDFWQPVNSVKEEELKPFYFERIGSFQENSLCSVALVWIWIDWLRNESALKVLTSQSKFVVKPLYKESFRRMTQSPAIARVPLTSSILPMEKFHFHIMCAKVTLNLPNFYIKILIYMFKFLNFSAFKSNENQWQ